MSKTEQACKELLRTCPQSLIVLNVLGAVLAGQDQLPQAIQVFDQIIQLKPDYVEAYNNRSNALKDLGQLEAAVDSYNRAIELQPDYAEAHSNLIFTQDFLSSMDLIQQHKQRQLWDQRFIQPLQKYHSPHPNPADSERPLRIGYLSADFKRHSAAQGFADLILSYEAKQFQVYCYSGVGIGKKMS